MPTKPTPSAPVPRPASEVDDAELVGRIARNDQAAFEVLMRRHNGKLFRVARAILKDDAEAEEALQDAYLDAYRHINDFRGGSRLSTWLTRIVINRALMRLRKHRRDRIIVPFGDGRAIEPDQAETDMADERRESPPGATLRAALARDMDMATVDVFGFAGERCDRIVAGVLVRALALAPGSPVDAR